MKRYLFILASLILLLINPVNILAADTDSIIVFPSSPQQPLTVYEAVHHVDINYDSMNSFIGTFKSTNFDTKEFGPGGSTCTFEVADPKPQEYQPEGKKMGSNTMSPDDFRDFDRFMKDGHYAWELVKVLANKNTIAKVVTKVIDFAASQKCGDLFTDEMTALRKQFDPKQYNITLSVEYYKRYTKPEKTPVQGNDEWDTYMTRKDGYFIETKMKCIEQVTLRGKTKTVYSKTVSSDWKPFVSPEKAGANKWGWDTVSPIEQVTTPWGEQITVMTVFR